jgi:hypothetical protein
MGKRTSIYVQGNMDTQIKSRGGRSTVVSRDLERLYTLYSRALKQIDLTVEEGCLIVDSLNSTLHDADSARMLWGGIEDSIELDGLAEKWAVDGPALVEKLKGLNEIQALAIVDAAERFWNGGERNEDIKAAVKDCFGIRA